MNADLEHVKAIFLEAVEQGDSGERNRYVQEACAGRDELRQQVEILLQAHESGSLLDKGAIAATPTIGQPLIEKPGTRIGPYKLLQEIGEGGMGVVYMAEQTEPIKRRVALKIIKPGMDTRQVIARFEAERQALAMMDHPSIAKVLDAGATDSGRPYFVMELVNGLPVTEFCDEQQLTPKERLELFVPICQAVQHAHQKGVIHRDLKPNNILVALYDGQPVPKIIDFGVAKATGQTLTEKTVFTQLGQVVGTLEYMSPEQAERNQLDTDTRSDIYSLGVILYELLTGDTPFDRQRLRSAAFGEILRIIREEEPPKPSTKLSGSQASPSIAASRHTDPQKLAVAVRGELDCIVMRAMEKARARRYQTANDLAADIQRYLKDEPILARPASNLERAARWLRRHPAITTATSVCTLVIVLAVSIAFLSIDASRDRALLLADEMTQLASEKGALAERERQAKSEARDAWARETEQRKRAEQAQAEQELAVAETRAVLDFLVLDMIGAAHPARSLGEQLTVRQMLDQAADRVGAAFTGQAETEAAVRAAIGRAYHALGLHDESAAQLDAAYRSRQELLGEDHLATLETAIDLGAALNGQGKHEQEQELEEKTLALLQRRYGATHAQALEVLGNLAANLHSRGEHQQAERLLVEVWEKKSRAFGPEHASTLATLGNLATNLSAQGRLNEAEDLYREILEIRQRKLGAEHPDVLRVAGNLAFNLDAQARYVEAEPLHRQVLEACRRVLGEVHPDTLAIVNNLAVNLDGQERGQEASLLVKTLVETYRNALGPRHPRTITVENNAAMRLLEHGDNAAAEKLLVAVSENAELALGAKHPTTNRIRQNLAQALVNQGKFAEAEALLSRVLASREAVLGPRHAQTLNTMTSCVALRMRLGKFSEARSLCERAVEGCHQEFGPEDQRTLAARHQLAGLQMLAGDYQAASRGFFELVEVLKHRKNLDSMELLRVRYNLGAALAKQGAIESAVAVFEDIAAAQKRQLPSDHPANSTVVELLGQLRQGHTEMIKIGPDQSLCTLEEDD